MADLFISYARDDRRRITRLVDALEDAGYTVWWDVGLLSGANFAREIQGQIDQAGAVVVVWTEKATESDWVLAEAQRAHAREKLLCARVPELPLDRVPLPYNALHTIDANDIAQLMETLRSRAIYPSRSERVWDFYAEPVETRRRAMERFRRITGAYLEQVGSKPPGTLDPILDVRIQHATRYSYDRHVLLSDQLLRVHPTLHYARMREYSLSFNRPPDEDDRYNDLFDNVVRRIAYRDRQNEFGFDVSMVINLTPFNPFLYTIARDFCRAPFRYGDTERHILQPYLLLEGTSSRFSALPSASTLSGTAHADVLVEMMKQVGRSVTNWYDPERVTGESRSLDEILASGRATSGEQARLLVNLLRSSGLAARYVGGYLLDFLDSPSDPGVDAEWSVDYSGWVQTYVPGGGWVGLDPMTQLLTNELYVPLACGPRPEDTTLLQGMVEEAEVRLTARSWATPVHRGLTAGSD